MSDEIVESKLVVVFDTQLFLRAAINPRSLPSRLLFEFGERYLLAFSKEVRAEIEDVLNRTELRSKFPALTDERVTQILALIDSGRLVTLDEIPSVCRDPKDDIFLATAVESQADYLVSEDKDLLVIQDYQGTKVLNALEFLRALTPS